MLRILLLAICVVVGASLLPVQPPQQSTFADPAFVRYFQRAGVQGRALLWGAGPIESIVEPFSGAPGNRRLVEYFERGRMELATDDTESSAGVTVGLLVREMATGNVQVGFDAFVQGEPAAVPIFGSGDGTATERVTYADFAADARARDADRTRGDDNSVTAWMTPGGTVEERAAPELVALGRYDAETGHNIPAIVDRWLATAPLGALEPLEVLGHPISEPYWVESGKGPQGVSLVQLYERRLVVYTPGLPEGERFSLANSGRHYYQWRYADGTNAGAHAAARRDSVESILPVGEPVGLTVPEGFSATRVDVSAGDVVDIDVGPDGRIALLRAGGRVDLYDPRTGSMAEEPFIENLVNPIALSWSGTALYVVDDLGVQRFEDVDADGQPDVIASIIADGLARASVALDAGPDAGVYVAGRTPAATGTPETDMAERPIWTINEDGAILNEARLPVSSGPLLADPDGLVWFVDAERRLASLDLETGVVERRMDLAALGTDATVVGLVLYRQDGTAGSPDSDVLAIVRDGDAGGRLVRILPGRRSATPTPPAGEAVPAGALVEFAAGFDQPVAAATGLDGSLYVLDSGREALYLIRPSR